MMNDATRNITVTPYDLASWTVSAACLLLVLHLQLLPALLAGLLVYELVHVLSPLIRIRAVSSDRAKVIVVALLAVLIVAVLTLLILGAVSFFRGGGGLSELLQRMAGIIEGARDTLPPWLVSYLPEDAETLRAAMVEWLREHAGVLQVAGKEVGRLGAHILVGMVIGALVSLRAAVPVQEYRLLARALVERSARLSSAFRRIVFAQGWIAGLNAFFTWLYLGVALPLLGVDLPLVKTLVAVTFVAGLLPVVGNLISNTIIVIVSLSYSLPVALASLVFLVVIHKLEYFLNARIIGSRIGARPWELLVAMLVMEAAFGITGLIAAPIYYAYIKDELTEKGLV